MEKFKNSWKILPVLLLVFLVGCSLGKDKELSNSGGTKDGGDKKIVVYGIYKAGDQVWFIDEGKAAEEKVKEMGGEFIYVDAKMNPEEYLKAIDNAIANQAAGILTTTPDEKLSQTVVDQLAAAGIPVVAADDPLITEDGDYLAPWFGIDGFNIGKTSGEWASDYILDNNLLDDDESAILLMTMDTVSSVVPRTEGMIEAFKEKMPDYSKDKIFRADYNGETEKGFNAANAIFTAQPKIKKWMVLAPNDEGGIGAVRALEQAGVGDTSTVIGLGGYLAKDEFKAGNKTMKAATYFSPQAVGGKSAEALMDFILNGKEIPEKYAVDAIIVTPENYEEVMGDAAK